METATVNKIYIYWEGPYPFSSEDIEKWPSDIFNSNGLYQIYGYHPVYCSDVLLYIGQTTRTFYDEVTADGNLTYYESRWCDTMNLKIYIGRLVGTKPESDNKWLDEIRIAEKLLIIAHKPALNAQDVKWGTNKESENYLIVNRGNYRSLMPEIYGERWVEKGERAVYMPMDFYKNR